MSSQPATTADTASAGSLVVWLRARSDAELGRLLVLRPDLALPAPADLSTLAARVTVRTSVQRAVDDLDAATLRVLEAAVVAGAGASVDEIAAVVQVPPQEPALDTALLALRERALLWDDGPGWFPAGPVAEAVGPHPAGLGRPLAALLARLAPSTLQLLAEQLGVGTGGLAAALADPARLRRELGELPEQARAVLDRLTAGPPVGSVRGTVTPEPVQQLIARRLVLPLDGGGGVELPRELGLALRAEHDVPAQLAPPRIALRERTPAQLDQLGSTAVFELLRLVEALGRSWSAAPPAVLRSGGIGVRELRRTARDLGVDEATAALLVETAYAAGLVNATSGLDPVYLPTVEFDSWTQADPAPRWSRLAGAWVQMVRQPSLVGLRGDRDRTINALGPDAERGTIPALRLRVLDVLAQLPPGSAPVEAAEVLARFAWQAPRRASAQQPLAETVLAEAAVIGVTAAGGLTGYSRTLLDGSRAVAEQVLASALPPSVDEFVVQPDLTIVVPGPATPQLAAELSLVADLESSGGASVYRVTEASVRRGLDAGRSRDDLVGLLTSHSRTPIPQALSYLIDDAARRHGVLRTGVAGCYLRCDDEALLARVVAERNTHALQLRLIAPTVAISAAGINQVLDVLRDAGFAPAAEAPDGQVVSLERDVERAPSRPEGRSLRDRAAARPGAQLTELVRRIRAGDNLATVHTRVGPIVQQVPGVTSATTMGLLRDAIRQEQQVWLGYADSDGTTTRHIVLPISMAGGLVRGYEPDGNKLRAFSLHRITSVGVVGGVAGADGMTGE